MHRVLAAQKKTALKEKSGLGMFQDIQVVPITA
jgi:hypothetical protein